MNNRLANKNGFGSMAGLILITAIVGAIFYFVFTVFLKRTNSAVTSSSNSPTSSMLKDAGIDMRREKNVLDGAKRAIGDIEKLQAQRSQHIPQ